MKIHQSIIAGLLLAATTTQAFVPLNLAFTSNRLSYDGYSTSLQASTLERLPDSAVRIKIGVPGSATKAAYDKVCTELSKTITLPGFRKGSKIPPAVLENAMAAKGGRNALRVQAINTLLSELIESAIKEEHGLEPIGQPALETAAEELADNFKPGDDFDMFVKCDVWPEIQWTAVEGSDKPYMGMKGDKFNKALGDLRERYVTLEPIEDKDYALQMGDACVVNMEGYMATDDGQKGEKLPEAASGDRVDVVLGDGRYMTGLVEGLVNAKVEETKEVKVTFPEALKDKTLAGKTAIFDVTVLEASKRTLPEVTDEFANEVRAGLTAETLKKELQTAVDTEDAKEYTPARNAALAKSLALVMDVEVPDTLVTNQAREKFAMMMADMRNNGVNDDEIKNQINSDNFLKYKNIVKDDIIKDFKVSMATDEIARLENIEVEDYQIEEQMESIKQDAENSKEDFDETQIRSRVEATLLRQAVMDFLAEKADLEVKFVDGEGEFDESLMEKLAEESQAREESFEVETTEESEVADESSPVVEASATEEKEVEEETPVAEPVAEDRDLESMSLADKAFYALKDAGALDADGAK
ncbi:trigger factor [Fragilariopsis cylindrus CCMP1102]|uniref:peptidylprolyl isomerase n=1 Tax=Fragilariopsis cylindrus CCMP1102 TaxID=635003 RepID=A0A1E7FHB8_9STRA|nr:trigger factor [Fragilariopsis cylindrus CCMP1102]|eukprot:OEU17524.1 trigger factor [Fragilariopsis cylindrus CCMP1102]